MQVPPWIKTAWKVSNDFVDITDRRHIYLLASGIAFNQLLCLIPFVLMTISIISTFLDPSAVKQTVAFTLSQVLPTGISATSIITDVILELSNVFNYSTLAGWIAGFVLIWTASALFSSMRSGLNAIFHIPTPKIFLWYRLKDIGLTMMLVTLLSASIVLSPLMSFFQTAGQDIVPLGWQAWVFGWTVRITTIVVTTLTFLAMYRIIPNGRVPWSIVVVSAGIAVIFWESARFLFAWYVASSQNLGKFYGGYVMLASLALWLYYSALVFLLAAEIAQFIHAHVKTKANPPV